MNLAALGRTLRDHTGLAAKADIATVAARLGLNAADRVPVGDDCAAIPDGDGFLLLAIEGFMNEFAAADPWFAGWCGVMVNLSDIAAMGGRPVAVVDALWADGADQAAPLLAGLRAAAETYGVPVVGGHSNLRTERNQLAVAVLGRAQVLLSSFAARPGDRLIAAIDLRGAYREPFSNWQAIAAPPARLRGDLALLPALAEDGLVRAAKDISQGGIVGTAVMLAECSGVAIEIEIDAVPRPPGVAPARWLTSFPSFGFLLAVAAADVAPVLQRFAERDIAAAEIGSVAAGSQVTIRRGNEQETIWDFAERPLLGCGPRQLVS